MKKLTRNKQHTNSKSHDVTICEHNTRKVKYTYSAYNANERYDVELFDGNKWNNIATIQDLGVVPNKSAYNILQPNQRENRANTLYTKASKYVKTFL